MTATVSMVNTSAATSNIQCRSGNTYQVDQNGYVTVNLVDAVDLLGAGFMPSKAGPILSGQQYVFGGAPSALFKPSGLVNVQISASGINPGATGADNVLAVYSLPAGAFDAANRGIKLTAYGSFGATANNKLVKLIANPTAAVVGSTVTGGTVIASTGTVTTSGGGWMLDAEIFKYGAAGSNTQIALTKAALGAAADALLAPTLLTAAENGAILLAVTGNATTAVTDIVFNALKIQAMD